MDTQPKRRGRPPKDPSGKTQRQIRDEERAQRRLEQMEISQARDCLDETVTRSIEAVFEEHDWVSKVVARLFMSSMDRVMRDHPGVDPRDLADEASRAFSEVIGKCASFDGLRRATSKPLEVRPVAMPSVGGTDLHQFVESAAAPTFSDYAGLMDDLPDDADDLPPLSDEDAAAMGFLPE